MLYANKLCRQTLLLLQSVSYFPMIGLLYGDEQQHYMATLAAGYDGLATNFESHS